MPKGGQNRKSTKIHQLQGTFRADRHARPAGNGPRGTLPPPPKWLPVKARRAWRDLAPLLEAVGGVTEGDGPALAMLCVHYAAAREAAEIVAKQGILVPDPEHQAGGAPSWRKNPALQILRDHSAAFRAYAERFGLTPQARKALDITPPDPAEAEISEFEAFLERGRRLRAEREAAARRRAAEGA